MFKKKKVKLGEAQGLLTVIYQFTNGLEEMPYKVARRLDRQITKLKDVQGLVSEAHEAALETVLGKEAIDFAKKSNEDVRVDELLGDKMPEYNKEFSKEMEAEYEGDFLTESFEGFFEEMDLPTKTAFNLVALAKFYEENELWEA